MENYTFNFYGKTYELKVENCGALLNDEGKPLIGFEISELLLLLNQSDAINFDVEYFDSACDQCFAGKAEKLKHFRFLEFHFYLFSLGGKYVLSSISKTYEEGSFNQLAKRGIVDDCYICSVVVCENCSTYYLEIEQCDF
ncbi:MAG: DUF3785 family protein [Vallitaleaceae bacterium]|nr:DUF3785 family protein [Vallitaleaceae bacterium]